jgi:hypothetical protein
MEIREMAESLQKVSETTRRTLRVWLKGAREDLSVYRIPIQYLYFNIENGRYADKMLQLRADNPGVDVDPKLPQWRDEIYNMLKGDYKGTIDVEGTERDKIAFERLKEDMRNREQLNPGIVLADGGVIDGNRRLAVLISLGGERFSRFDGVILPEDISSEDRWRIEVGVQLGKDQQLDYSPINKLLKIRQGLDLYKSSTLPSGKTAEDMVADALYGVSRKEVLDSIDLMNLIDEYLDFFKIKGQYQYVADQNERFIEALGTLRAAQDKLELYKKAKLKTQLFVIIKEGQMSNWEIRNIRRALGGSSRSRGRKSTPIRKAIDHLIMRATDPKMVRNAYANNTQTRIVEKSKTTCEEFKEIYDAESDANQPLALAKGARAKLQTLRQSLKDFTKTEDGLSITKELESMKKLIRACLSTIKLPKHRAKR